MIGLGKTDSEITKRRPSCTSNREPTMLDRASTHSAAAAPLERLHEWRAAPYDDLAPDGSLTPALHEEFELAWRVVEKRGRLRTGELLGALSICGFALTELELLAHAGPGLLGKPHLERHEFMEVYLRLVATDMPLNVSVRRGFSMFDDGQSGALPAQAVRRALQLAAAQGEPAPEAETAANDRVRALYAALGLEPSDELDVGAFALRLRAGMEAAAALLARAHLPDTEGVGLALEADRERHEEAERALFAAELAALQPQLAVRLARASPPVAAASADLGRLRLALGEPLEFTPGEARFERAEQARAQLLELARLLAHASALLHAAGKPPLHLAVQARAAEDAAGPRAALADLALRRAEAARAALRAALREAWPPALSADGVPDGALLIDVLAGHGGGSGAAAGQGAESGAPQASRLEFKLLSPAEGARLRGVRGAGEPMPGAQPAEGAQDEPVAEQAAGTADAAQPARGGSSAAAAAEEDAAEEEDAAYARLLGEVQVEAAKRIGARAPLVSLDLGALAIRTERQWSFKGRRRRTSAPPACSPARRRRARPRCASASPPRARALIATAGDSSEYLDASAEVGLTEQVGLCLHEIGAALQARGQPHLRVVLEGHTVNAVPAEPNEALSLQRAERVRDGLVEAICALRENRRTAAELRAQMGARGLGGATLRQRCVRLRVLPPSERGEGGEGGEDPVAAAARAGEAGGAGEAGSAMASPEKAATPSGGGGPATAAAGGGAWTSPMAGSPPPSVPPRFAPPGPKLPSAGSALE